jgi:transglutaminase-like putative cysteine protease
VSQQQLELARREDRLLLFAFACGAGAIAIALESWALGAGAVVTTLSAILARARRRAAPPALEAGLGLLAALAGAPLAMQEQSAAPGLALFLLVAQAVKLSAPRAPRDESLALVIGVVLAGVGASEGVSPIFGVLFLANVLTLLSLSALRTRRALVADAERAQAPIVSAAAAPGGRAARALSGAAGRLRTIAPIALVTVAFFLVFPRIGAHLLPSQRESRDRLSGFTDVVGLEDMGRIQQSDAIAFRAELLTGTLQAAPYWRGRAMDLYDGETWQTSRVFGFTGTPLSIAANGDLHEPLIRVPDTAPSADVVIYQEPFGTRCLFTVGTLRAVQFKTARPALIERDALGAVLAVRAPAVPIAYRVVVHPQAEVPSLHETALTKKRISDYCLRLPDRVDRERLLDYTRTVLRARGVAPDAPPSVIARALEDHLATEFRYSLEAGRTPGTEPVADFLFNLRAGHCEYFAATLAVLLRLNGVPARLVSGFRGGDYSGWSQAWTVRQRDAHAWVEAETEHGWTRYDATPAQVGGEASAIAEAATAVADWLELRWYKWVIAYDAYDQRSAIVKLRDFIAETGADLRERLAQLAPDVPVGVVALALAAAVSLGAWLLALGLRARRRGQHTGPGVPRGPDAALVADVLAALAARGVIRRPDETIQELMSRARRELGPACDDLVAWVPAYYAARFGAASSDARRNDGARRALATLRSPP